MLNPLSRIKGPAALYRHDHPPVRNINALSDERSTRGQRVADRVASIIGGWPFIIVQSALLFAWICVNVYMALHPSLLKAFDPYPFILLNLMLSFQAAYTGPVVMMSQNRQADKDRLMAENDYHCNVKAEDEIRVLMDHLVHQDEFLARQEGLLADQRRIIERLAERLGVSSDGVGDMAAAAVDGSPASSSEH